MRDVGKGPKKTQGDLKLGANVWNKFLDPVLSGSWGCPQRFRIAPGAEAWLQGKGAAPRARESPHGLPLGMTTRYAHLTPILNIQASGSPSPRAQRTQKAQRAQSWCTRVAPGAHRMRLGQISAPGLRGYTQVNVLPLWAHRSLGP